MKCKNSKKHQGAIAGFPQKIYCKNFNKEPRYYSLDVQKKKLRRQRSPQFAIKRLRKIKVSFLRDKNLLFHRNYLAGARLIHRDLPEEER